MGLLSPELSWACSHLAAPPEQLWSWSSPCAGVVREYLGRGRRRKRSFPGARIWPGDEAQSDFIGDHIPECKAEMSSCEEKVAPGNVAMLTQLPQHIHMPPFMSFIVPKSRSKVLGRHMPLLLLLPPPLSLHRAAAGKKGKKADLGKTWKAWLSSSSGIIPLLPA